MKTTTKLIHPAGVLASTFVFAGTACLGVSLVGQSASHPAGVVGVKADLYADTASASRVCAMSQNTCAASESDPWED
ncbi:hypothetical protein GCM10007079_26050 [Nocardiopsis terrae]|uniref:Uncharacterized protein n=1 Tax=Nocardiopsis terrae TaxID=372655 RepID=A0ABR9HFJ3_9ACTN|nr:hypothetical protein [Nocardiopsis terrae]MBE1457792.1 hypothetical protein [Nocardiopsis terrae]GHC84244.1 hypothetical protein GCM10007079_26050 [Nocardiopsis terrae]